MYRRLLLTVCCALAAASAASAVESVMAAADSRAGAVSVSAVQPAANADLILLSRGFDAGLRQGMLCIVHRADAVIGELLLVDLRAHAAAGLITQLSPGAIVRAGDAVTVKTQSS